MARPLSAPHFEGNSMEQEFEEREGDIKESIRRFEQMLDQQESQFFDLDVYEQMVEHYLNHGDLDKAFKAAESGLENFPYALELMLDKAQILANFQRFDESLVLLERASLFNPGDLDVPFMQGSALNMACRYEESIQVLEE